MPDASHTVPRQLSQTELMRVITDLFKPKLTAESLEVGIVRMRKSLGQVHAASATEANFGLFRNQALAQGGECN